MEVHESNRYRPRDLDLCMIKNTSGQSQKELSRYLSKGKGGTDGVKQSKKPADEREMPDHGFPASKKIFPAETIDHLLCHHFHRLSPRNDPSPLPDPNP